MTFAKTKGTGCEQGKAAPVPGSVDHLGRRPDGHAMNAGRDLHRQPHAQTVSASSDNSIDSRGSDNPT